VFWGAFPAIDGRQGVVQHFRQQFRDPELLRELEVPTVAQLVAGGEPAWRELCALVGGDLSVSGVVDKPVRADRPARRGIVADLDASARRWARGERLAELGMRKPHDRWSPPLPEPIVQLVEARAAVEEARAERDGSHRSRKAVAAAEKGMAEAERAAAEWHVSWAELVRGFIADTAAAEPSSAAPIPIGAPSWR
jgi:hypothetical protein